MPTIITHSVLAGTAAWGFKPDKSTVKLWALSLICSSLPDADVIGYRYFYVTYESFFGHRGFFHSPFFALLLAFMVAAIFYRKEILFSINWWKYVLYFFLLTASHGVLDALTNGGNGIALLSPLSNARYFFPWTPIEVSPFGIRFIFSQRGLAVFSSEMMWVWLPCLCALILMTIYRKKCIEA
jgi:inner membrane protein